MADDLKRVGIRLTADGATDFKQSLKDIAALSQESRSELKLAQSQYDENTSSVQKLADQQKYLSDQTDLYRDKVTLLTQQLAEMESAEDADQAAIEKKKTELNNAQATLNNYESKLKDVTDKIKSHSAQLKEWGDKISAVGDKVSKVGDTLTKTVTGPIVAIAGASVAAWKEVDEAMDIIVTKTGASGEALEEMQKVAENIATTIPTDFETAATAVGEVNTRFGLMGEELDKVSSQFIKFAEINGQDVNGSIDQVQATMAAWGIEASHTGTVLDLLNKVGQDTGTDVIKLAADLQTNKVVLDEMGLSITDAANFLGNLDKNGIDSSAMLAGLKKALQNATKDGVSMDAALAQLETTLKSGQTNTEAYQAAMELFGNKAGPAIAEAVQSGKISFEELQGTLTGFAGSVEETFEATLDPMDQMQPILNELKATGADLVTTAGPMIVELLSSLSGMVKGLCGWWSSLSDEQKVAVEKFALLAAAAGPLLSIGGRMISGAGTLVSTFGTISGSITAAGGIIPAIGALATAAAPFLIGGAIIAGVIAAGVLIYKNWDTIKEKAGQFKEGVTAHWEDLKEKTAAAFGEISERVTADMELARSQTTEKTLLIQSAIDGFKADGIVGSFTFMAENIRAKIEAAGGNVSGAVEGMQKVADAFNERGILGVFDLIKSGIGSRIDEARDKVDQAIQRIKGFLDFHWELPHLAMPHFSVSGSPNPLDWFTQGVPTLSVDWYAKAMNSARILTEPTVFGTSGGKLLAGGEAGNEVISGETHLMDLIRSAVRTESNSEINYGGFTFNIYPAPGMDEQTLAEYTMQYIQERIGMDKRVFS